MLKHFAVLGFALFMVGQSGYSQEPWREILAQRLPLYGHRNWIVIADSAYPAQARPGIETVVANAGQIELLRAVLDALGKSAHVRPIVYLDRELSYLDDQHAPGVMSYRTKLAVLLKNARLNRMRHEQIIAKLDEAGQTFRVLIIKSNMTIPYTSVFLQLDCAYWGPADEERLRAEMAAHPEK